MVNATIASTVSAAMALAAVVVFYTIFDDVMQSRRVPATVYVYVYMWHCDGWAGKMYPTEKSMKEVFK